MEGFSHERSDLDEVTAEFSIVVPKDEYVKRVTAEVQKLKSHVSVRGFRKGKAPVEMIKKLHGDRVRGEVTQRLVSETLYQALEKEKIEETVGDPEFSIESNSEDKDFSYKAKVFFPPRPEITGYDSFTVELEEKSVSDEDVENGIKELLSSQATIRSVEGRDKVQEGDIVKGKVAVNVEDQDPGSEEPIVVKVGDGRLPEELEKGLLGVTVGQTEEIESTVPDTHQDEELRGKKTTYIVTVEEIQEQEFPELTDDFVKTLGYGVETVLELRIKVREQLEEQQKNGEKTEVHAQILKELLEKNSFSVPQSLVDSEVKALLVRNGLVDPQKVDVSRISAEPFREQLGPMAEERVRTTVIIDQIVAQEKVEFSDEDIDGIVGEISEQHGLDKAEVEKILLGEGRRESFIREHQQKKALDMLYDRAKIKYVQKKEEKEEKKAKKKTKKAKKGTAKDTE